jgi:DNA-binding CsgD family transcriptional regulator
MNNTENSQAHDIRFDGNDFNNKLIDSLPGIFYLYHVIEGDIILKRWNKKHVTDLEYSDEELKNINGSVFFSKKEFVRVLKEIQVIFVKGWNDIHVTLLTKSGKKRPYYLQGYQVNVDGKKYLMGVGIDETEYVQLKKRLDKSEKEKLKKILEKEKAEASLHAKERELLTAVIQESNTARIVKEAAKKMEALQKKYAGTEMTNDLKEIQNIMHPTMSNNNHWEIFKLRFREIHPEFFYQLKKKHPALTETEVRFCAYLRLHLSGYQITSILNISKEGIKKTRYRIRKKFGLQRRQSLEEYICLF